MEKVSKRKQAVLTVLDDQIEELEAKLAKFQPYINELENLKRARAALLNERSVTMGGRQGSTLTMEQVILDLQTNGASSVPQMSERLGVPQATIRSHLNRHMDVRYRKNGNGNWALIGPEDELDDEVEEED